MTAISAPILIFLLLVMPTALFTSAHIIDHGSFSVMIDDLDITRPPPSTPDPITSSDLSSASSPSSIGLDAPLTNQTSLRAAPGLAAHDSFPGQDLDHDLSMPSNDSASNILAAIRSSNDAADLQQRKPTADPLAAAAGASTPRGYLSSPRSADKRPSAISIVEEDLLVVPVEGGQPAIAYELSAVDQYGHKYRAGLRQLPGLRPVPQQGVGVMNPWPMLGGSAGALNPQQYALLQQQQQQQQYAVQQQAMEQGDLQRQLQLLQQQSNNGQSAQQQSLSDQDAVLGLEQQQQQQQQEGQDQADLDGSGPGVVLSPAMTTNGEDVVVSNSSSSSSEQAGWIQTGQGPLLRPSDGRHFVHIRDDDDDGDDDDDDARLKKHGAQHHDGGEHKKPARRQPIRKPAEEWRCLETSLESGAERVEKLVCPPGLMIASFGLASLGDPVGSCTGPSERRPGLCHVDLAPSLQSACLGKAVCDLVGVSVANLSAQCPGGGGRRAVVEYECAPWVSAPTPANSTAERCQQVQTNGTLQCPDGQAILGFGFGFYGEIDGSCAKGISPGICSRNVMTDLTAQCVGRTQCRIDVGAKQFGSACGGNSSNTTTSSAIYSLAASFKCGSFAEAAANTGKGSGNQSYPSGSLQFATAKGNGASTPSGMMALAMTIVMGMMAFVI